MKIGKSIVRLITFNTRQVFAEARIGRYWYVLFWARGSRPCAYRSTDGTPPRSKAHGRLFFGSAP